MDAAGCQLKKNSGQDGPRFDLGNPSENALELLGQNQLRLRYTSGDSCRKDQFTRSMVIHFSCDPNAPDDSTPQFKSESDECEYMFEWKTKMACPVESNQTRYAIVLSKADQQDQCHSIIRLLLGLLFMHS